jgi:hypothetical protein
MSCNIPTKEFTLTLFLFFFKKKVTLGFDTFARTNCISLLMVSVSLTQFQCVSTGLLNSMIRR